MPAKKKTGTPDFEKSLQALEKILNEMESGKLSLEESLQAYETGVKLSAECQQALAAAEQRVTILADKYQENDAQTTDTGQDE